MGVAPKSNVKDGGIVRFGLIAVWIKKAGMSIGRAGFRVGIVGLAFEVLFAEQVVDGFDGIKCG